MKKEQVKLGGTYLAKVSGKVVPVRLDAENSHGGWQAFNLETRKTVRIKSAQRLRQASKTTTVDAGGGIMVDVVESKAATPAKAVKAPKTPKEPKVKKISGLDAAAQVLKDKGEPMTCGDIVETMLAKGMWKTGGKTPAATIYSAMLREIDGKPAETRFTKTGRGLFALAKTKA